MPIEDGLTPSTALTVDNDSPFYESVDLTSEKDNETRDTDGKQDADSIKNIQVSSNVNPSPNTLVPVGSNGKLPASIIPSNGTWALVESISPTAVSSQVLSTTLSSGSVYILQLYLTQNTSAGILQIQFNNDSGTNYLWNTFVEGAGNGTTATTSSSSWAVTYNSTGANPGDGLFAWIKIAPFSSYTLGISDMVNVYSAESTGVNQARGVCKYKSSATSIKVVTTAGTFSGTIHLYQEGTSVVVGATGPQGIQGPTGPQGVNGAPGTGFPAYHYWASFGGF